MARHPSQSRHGSLHPAAWWAWALALATATTRTTNPVLLGLILATTGFVVTGRRSVNEGRAFGFFLRMAAFVLVVRLLFEVVFGNNLPGDVLVRLPSIPLPSFLVGLRIGGPVTAQAMLTATYSGMQLAALLICVGAANALASPRRLLKAVPGALYELGVAVTVSMSFAPQLAHAATRVRRARRLRGMSSSGLRGWIGVALPVLQDALEKSIDLAAAMDSRGFGRRGAVSRTRRRVTTGAMLFGLLAVAVASYGLLDAGSPAIVGLPLLVAGSIVAAAAVLFGGRSSVRSSYRPDRWALPEWLTLGCGVAAVVGVLGAGWLQPGSLQTSTYPIVAPSVPWPALVGIAVALVPAWLTPSRRMTTPAASPQRQELIGAVQ